MSGELSQRQIPDLVNARNEFSNDPVRCGFKYFARRDLLPQLRAEMAAQFEKFHRSGLVLDHVNGHLNMHLHPTVLRLLLENARAWGVKALRLTRDSFWLNARVAKGRWLYRATHALIYLPLSSRARPRLQCLGICHTHRVFGLLQNGAVDEDYMLKLLAKLPGGDSELYSHPSLDEFRHEFEALVSPRVRQAIQARQIELIRYRDL